MALLYDIIALVIIAIFCLFGARRGFLRSIILLGSLVVALLVGVLVSNTCTEPIYNSYVKNKVETKISDSFNGVNIYSFIPKSQIEEKLGIAIPDSTYEEIINGDGTLTESVSDYAKKININISPEKVSEYILDFVDDETTKSEVESKLSGALSTAFHSFIQSDDDNTKDVLSMLINTDKEELPTEFTRVAIRPILLSVLKALVFIATFILLLIILRIIITITHLGRRSEISGTNRVLGAIFGLLKGILIVFIITYLITLISPFVGADSKNSIFSEATLHDSFVFRYVIDILNWK